MTLDLIILDYTCTIAFPMSFIGIYYWNNGGVGLHLIWIMILGTIMASISACAFLKCSKVYAGNNGWSIYLC
ncbi:hypothetical protein SHM_15590 [Spiroplasma ixodetis]|uniref:Uncharacterized protein n=1 Tax=Spiroplasma ixodetis TaxID=2141 RepID=A0ABN6SXR4_9MOLU|nr:hypothetical protein SHM_15590 [Spiroplasma ixodetis]